jgi:hypothetical protein
MSDYLQGCWEKRDRAEEVLEALNREAETGAKDPANVLSLFTQIDAKGTH